jgi:GNAT superfamily N-acetyltransferase
VTGETVRPVRGRDAALLYREPPRSYASALVPTAVIAIGFGIDCALGGASAHIVAWLIAWAIIVGVYVLTLYAARSTRTITVTADELRVGKESVERGLITGVDATIDPDNNVMGMTIVNELPRGAVGVTVVVADGTAHTVPTRSPERLAAALNHTVVAATVRPAEPGELEMLDNIGTRADVLFRVAGYDLPELPLDEASIKAAKSVFVVGRPVFGFVLVGETDGRAHIDELAVLPGQMRKGYGAALLESACEWARAQGYAEISLTTYEEVPWNAPFYARHGFAQFEPDGPDLIAQREWEAAAGLDAVGPRIAMLRALS